MLDVEIRHGMVKESDVKWVTQHLVTFYQTLVPIPLATENHMHQLREDLQSTQQELTHSADGLPGNLVQSLISQLLSYSTPVVFRSVTYGIRRSHPTGKDCRRPW